MISYFFLFGIVALVTYSIGLADANKFSEALELYFYCEAEGHPNDCQRSFENYSFRQINTAYLIFFSTIPLMQLVYILNVGAIKKWIVNHIPAHKMKRDTEIEMVADVNI